MSLLPRETETTAVAATGTQLRVAPTLVTLPKRGTTELSTAALGRAPTTCAKARQGVLDTQDGVEVTSTASRKEAIHARTKPGTITRPRHGPLRVARGLVRVQEASGRLALALLPVIANAIPSIPLGLGAADLVAARAGPLTPVLLHLTAVVARTDEVLHLTFGEYSVRHLFFM